MISIIIVALNSFFVLFLFKGETEQIFSDITENKELAVVYKKAGEMKDILEDYLKTGNKNNITIFQDAEQSLQQTINEELKEYVSSAENEEKEIQRKNLAGLFDTFMAEADAIFYAKENGNVEAYVFGYEKMLDVYKEIDLYIKEITSEQLMQKADAYEDVQRKMNKNYAISILITLAVVCVVVVLVMLYSVEMTKPILKLEKYAKRLEKRDFDFEVPEETSSEEMATLYRTFGKMKNSIRDYIAMSQKKQELEEQLNRQNIENLEMRNLLKEAELQALQAQINPHFLFNMINIGAQMATLHDDDDTADYFYHVADLFRYNIKGVDQAVTLKEELEYVLNYVKLMQTRFGSKYQFEYENKVEDSDLNLTVPKMILQPLVENAYTHGVRKSNERGRIGLFLEKKENQIEIHIWDSGPGMPPEKIRMILRGESLEKESKGNGIGLINVLTRLRLWAKTEDVMEIFCEQGITEFKLKLPVMRQEEKTGGGNEI